VYFFTVPLSAWFTCFKACVKPPNATLFTFVTNPFLAIHLSKWHKTTLSCHCTHTFGWEHQTKVIILKVHMIAVAGFVCLRKSSIDSRITSCSTYRSHEATAHACSSIEAEPILTLLHNCVTMDYNNISDNCCCLQIIRQTTTKLVGIIRPDLEPIPTSV